MVSNKGLLITFEGADSSGKATQAYKLYNFLDLHGYSVQKVEFPDYESPSSSLVKMYLGGSFGTDPQHISPYIASTFYTVDRYASYKKDWEEFYNNKGIVIADRYTTSNMIHQAVKIKEENEREIFLEWLWSFEFEIFNLPQPDAVIFLDMPPAYSAKLLEVRGQRQKEKADIHERDRIFLEKSYFNACALADKYGWYKINCVHGKRLKSVEDIHREVCEIVKEILPHEHRKDSR